MNSTAQTLVAVMQKDQEELKKKKRRKSKDKRKDRPTDDQKSNIDDDDFKTVIPAFGVFEDDKGTTLDKADLQRKFLKKQLGDDTVKTVLSRNRERWKWVEPLTWRNRLHLESLAQTELCHHCRKAGTTKWCSVCMAGSHDACTTHHTCSDSSFHFCI